MEAASGTLKNLRISLFTRDLTRIMAFVFHMIYTTHYKSELLI